MGSGDAPAALTASGTTHASPGRVALICPGQGSQKPGGIADLAPTDRAVFDRASAVIGVDLWAAGLHASEEQLSKPSVLQPLLLAWAQADWERARTQRPDLPALHYVLGHSSGQNSAAVLCGALAFEDGVRFAHERGRLMDRDCDATPNTLLALSGVTRAVAEEIAALSQTSIANHNAEDQFVVGGSAEAVARARARAESCGVKAVVLRVAGAFHTRFFRDSDALAGPLIDALSVREPFTPMIGNARGQVIDTATALRDEFRGQYSRPITWLPALQTAYAAGVRTFIVTGPGNAMAGLLRRFARTVTGPIAVVRLNQPLGEQ